MQASCNPGGLRRNSLLSPLCGQSLRTKAGDALEVPNARLLVCKESHAQPSGFPIKLASATMGIWQCI